MSLTYFTGETQPEFRQATIKFHGHLMLANRVFFLLMLPFVAVGCADLGEPSLDDFVNSPGTIIQDSFGLFLITTDPGVNGGFTTLYPLNLPDNLKSAGLRIRFSGGYEIAPNVRYRYPPIRLSRVVPIGQ